MKIIRNIDNLKQFPQEFNKNNKIGLIPTMGALHAGHLSLIDTIRDKADILIATIFVNPTQFAQGEDLDSYPKTLNADLEAFEKAGVDAVFLPTPEIMYPENFATYLNVKGVAEELEAHSRPHFFHGVAVIVLKLFNLSRADIAVFGEKDYQQLAMIKQMVRDLNVDIDIISSPTIREADGLALSSRNTYLNQEERRIAPTLHATLQSIKNAILSLPAGGTISEIETIINEEKKAISNKGFELHYLELRDKNTLKPITEDTSINNYRLLVAAKIGKTRLIDNIGFE